MSFLESDPVTRLAFSIVENKGVYAVLLGSGLSRSAEIPTGWEITLDLVRRVALAQGAAEQGDWADWYRQTTGNEPGYSDLLEAIAVSPAERRSILHSYIEPTEDDRSRGRKVPTAAHHAIASLVKAGYIRVIVTTNFDRLMENALREAGVEPTVVSSSDALQGAEPLAHSTCYLVKLHGDYKDSRILNTDSELQAYPPEYDRLLDRIFDEYGLIVAGWSGEWDHALRAAMLRRVSRRYPTYWAARGAISEQAAALVGHLKAIVTPVTGADQFFSELQRKIETLHKSRRQNPESIELLIGTTKRLLAKPVENRIELDELFANEAQKLIQALGSSEFNIPGAWDPEKFASWAERHEALTEPVGRMLGVIGRWGSEADVELGLSIVRSMYASSQRPAGGLTVFIAQWAYPTVLAFTSFALGLTRSERWESLHKLLRLPVENRYNSDPSPLVSEIFLFAWDNGGNNELWQALPGLERRKAALSDHLFDVMSDWRSSFTGSIPDFELLYVRFECLASLAFLERVTEEQLEQTLAGPAGGRNFEWMPVGRAGWQGPTRKKVLTEFESSPLPILHAGFAHGSRRFMELFAGNLNRIGSRMSW